MRSDRPQTRMFLFRRALTLIATLFALLAGLAFPGPVRAQVFHPESFSLANGMEVVVIPNHRVPVVTHMVWYKVGSADETPGKTGLAHMLEHMMFKGTAKVPAGQFSNIVAQNGGRDNAFTTADYTVFYQNVAAGKLATVMRLEADRMANLKLEDKEFQPERKVVLEERRMRVENDPDARLGEQMAAALYLNYPYHHPVIGWHDEIEHYRLSDVVAFYKRWYAPNNAILVVSGDITAKQLKPLAEKYYGSIPARKVPPRHRGEEPPPAAARTVELRDADVEQSVWSRDYLAPSYHEGETRQAYPLQVLAEIVGGGTTGRLYRSLVVEQKLAAAASADYSPYPVGPSTFSIEVVPRPGVPLDKVGAATIALLDEIAAKGVTPEEVEKAEDRLRASVSYARDSVNTSARVLGTALATGGKTADVEAWPRRIGAVTVDQVDEAARDILKDERSVTGLLLPAANGTAVAEDKDRMRVPAGGSGREIR